MGNVILLDVTLCTCIIGRSCPHLYVFSIVSCYDIDQTQSYLQHIIMLLGQYILLHYGVREMGSRAALVLAYCMARWLVLKYIVYC